MMQRRALLAGGFAALLLPNLPALARTGPRRIALKHLATGARFAGPWHNGEVPDAVAMEELSAALADDPARPWKAFDAEVISILWEVAAQTRLQGEIQVRSGYRTAQLNRAVHGVGDSQHLRAGALDIEVPAGRMPALAQAALALGKGGVGIYPRRGFVHLDSGPVRRWAEQTLGPTREQIANDRLSRVAEAWRSAQRTR